MRKFFFILLLPVGLFIALCFTRLALLLLVLFCMLRGLLFKPSKA